MIEGAGNKRNSVLRNKEYSRHSRLKDDVSVKTTDASTDALQAQKSQELLQREYSYVVSYKNPRENIQSKKTRSE